MLPIIVNTRLYFIITDLLNQQGVQFLLIEVSDQSLTSKVVNLKAMG